jgi:predicted glycogen debranching enzyme
MRKTFQVSFRISDRRKASLYKLRLENCAAPVRVKIARRNDLPVPQTACLPPTPPYANLKPGRKNLPDPRNSPYKMIQLNADTCQDFPASSAREWLETNGIGGYASSTVSGANTRRYHGLLTAAINPPVGRAVLLSKFEEAVVIGGERFDLSANRYPGAINPEGFKYLKSFRLDPFPVWTYEVGGIVLEKSVFMVHGENTTVCRWKVRRDSSVPPNELPNPADNRKSENLDLKSEIDARDKADSPNAASRNISLELKPLLAFRDYHHLRTDESNFDQAYKSEAELLSVRPVDNLPEIYFAHNADKTLPTGFWYRDFEYEIEKERGFDYRENLFQPFSLVFDLQMPAAVIVSTEKRSTADADELARKEIARRTELVENASSADEFTTQLVLAADQFIVSRGDGKTVIAGYHWFSDWGRDTMIALPGLTLAAGRPEIAKSILLEFSNHISEGMLPNRFPDSGETAEYNTVDATLWYFEAVRAYAEKTGDYPFVQAELYDKLCDIIAWHLRGTRYNIHVDTDGLLYAGVEGVQLTWMDAKISDYVVTPRTGKAVEIQALWYNALKIMADLAVRCGNADASKRYTSLADLAKLSFNAAFWNEADQCLFDVVINGSRDASVRPNQIFTVSLPHQIITGERARKIVEKVETVLLTPVGLRSLSPNDPAYRPIYRGSPYDRDSSYHQGTVWAWLIGPFIDARRKTFPDQEAKITEILSNFRHHLTEAGLGQISEIFDADPPHNPRGCIAQAWSVAEILRVIV